MEMIAEHKAVYIKLRAEIIKHFQDTMNPNHFVNGFCVEKARQIAKEQLEYDLKRGELRLTLEDMLLKTVEECISIVFKKRVPAIGEYFFVK